MSLQYVFTDLPRGYAKDIAKKLNCSEHTVYKVAKGKRKNQNIEIALCELRIDFNKRLSKLEELLTQSKRE